MSSLLWTTPYNDDGQHCFPLQLSISFSLISFLMLSRGWQAAHERRIYLDKSCTKVAVAVLWLSTGDISVFWTASNIHTVHSPFVWSIYLWIEKTLPFLKQWFLSFTMIELLISSLVSNFAETSDKNNLKSFAIQSSEFD